VAKKLTLIILPQAEQDADLIYHWLHGRSPQGAKAWYDALLLAFENLSLQGHIYSLAPEAAPMKRAIQQKLFKTARGRTYRILYEIEDEQLFVLHIRAPGQKPVRRPRPPKSG
jgi:plasmid stabilization system protein ParE